MQTYNSYRRHPKTDLFTFLHSLIRNSFCIDGLPMETVSTAFTLSSSSSPYLKRLNGYQNQHQIEPIIINI